MMNLIKLSKNKGHFTLQICNSAQKKSKHLCSLITYNILIVDLFLGHPTFFIWSILLDFFNRSYLSLERKISH